MSIENGNGIIDFSGETKKPSSSYPNNLYFPEFSTRKAVAPAVDSGALAKKTVTSDEVTEKILAAPILETEDTVPDVFAQSQPIVNLNEATIPGGLTEAITPSAVRAAQVATVEIPRTIQVGNEQVPAPTGESEKTIPHGISIFENLVPEMPEEGERAELEELIKTASLEELQKENDGWQEELTFYKKSTAPEELRKTRIAQILWMQDKLQDAINQHENDAKWLEKTDEVERQVAAMKEAEKEADIEALQEQVHDDMQAQETTLTEEDLTGYDAELLENQSQTFDHLASLSVTDIQELIENNLVTIPRHDDEEVKAILRANINRLRERLARERNIYLDSEGTQVSEMPEDLKPLLEEGAGAVNVADIVGQLGAQETVKAFADINNKYGAALVDGANVLQEQITTGEVDISEDDRFGVADGKPDAIAEKIDEVIAGVRGKVVEEAGNVDIADAVMAQIGGNRETEVEKNEATNQEAESETETEENQFGGFKTAELQMRAVELKNELQELRAKAESGKLEKEEVKTAKMALRDKFKAFLMEADLATPENFARFGIKE